MQRQALLISLVSCLMVLALSFAFIKHDEAHRTEIQDHLLQVLGSSRAAFEIDDFDSMPASTASLVTVVLLVASSVLVACLVYILVHQPMELRREVALRTQELTHINTVLASEIAERRRAETALAERTVRLETVRDVAIEITRELDLNTLPCLILQRAVTILNAIGGRI